MPRLTYIAPTAKAARKVITGKRRARRKTRVVRRKARVVRKKGRAARRIIRKRGITV